MSRIQAKFRELAAKKEKALITYIMAGYPNHVSTLAAVRGLISGGADIIELGFPFSDPLADGPVIQNASAVSLEKGTKISQFFELVRDIRKESDVPLVLMTYTNILYHRGYDKFFEIAKNAGIDGFITPDMTVEESREYLRAAKRHKIDTIFLVSPNTTKSRLEKIAKQTTGFLYLVSVFGTTGARTRIQKYTIDALRNTKKIVGKKIPIGIGFGVSTPSDVTRYVKNGADAVIIGSALIRLLERTGSKKIEKAVSSYTKKLKAATFYSSI
ncbi:MAG: tryptophan synthase subunit alpha [Candidatus Nitrosotenuis sp.]